MQLAAYQAINAEVQSQLDMKRPAPVPAPATAQKKLIEFGWDEPDTAFMREHIAEMEKSPFDGCVFHVHAKKPDGSRAGQITWEGWGERAFSEAEVAHAVEDLRTTPFKRFTHNFLRFNTTPAKMDWFDDHAAVIHNARLAAKVAREGRCAGILFDIEQYDGQLFKFRVQRDAKSKGWDAYSHIVRQRGREVMNAFQEGFPDLVVLLTFGHSLPFAQANNMGSLPAADYGLLAPFLDGMLDAARGKTRLVDGHELSYSYKDPDRFPTAYRMMSNDALAVVAADAEKYRQVYSFGFGIWLDFDHRKLGWNVDEPSKNYFTPELFEASVRRALETSDEYVWIYTETPRWWTDDSGGRPVKLPPAYIDALRRARQGLTKD
jgi:hypothetical protein